VEDADSKRALGMVSLHRIDWLRRNAGIGYWVRRSEWGRGIASEAARAVLEMAFHDCGLYRVEVHVALENKASQRVAEKVGLLREGVARGIEFVNGRYLDHVQYALLRSDVPGPEK
jgi:ribosomal-protein-serine acetyltransferase